MKRFIACLLLLVAAQPALAIERNVSSQKVYVTAIDSATGRPKTGDSGQISAYVAKDGGSVTQLTDTTATEYDSTNAKGVYWFDITNTETDAKALVVTGKSSTSGIDIVPQVLYTTPANFSLASIDSNGRLDLIKIAGTTQTTRDLGASVLVSSGTGTGQLNISSGIVQADSAKIGGQTASASGTVTFPNATLASTTNITAATGIDVTKFGGTNGTFSSGRPEVNTTHVAGTAQSSGDIIKELFLRCPVKTWFVAASGGNDSNAGTRSAPLATFAQAVTNANPGDTIYLLSGNYATSATLTCSKDHIRIIGEGNATKITLTTATPYTGVFTLSGHYCKVEDMWLVCANRGTGVSANSPGVKRPSVLRCRIDAYDDAVLFDGCDGAELIGNIATTHWDGYTVKNGSGLGSESCVIENNTVSSDCTATDATTGYQGMYVPGMSGRITGNNIFMLYTDNVATRAMDVYGIKAAASSLLGGLSVVDNTISVIRPAGTGKAIGIGDDNGASIAYLTSRFNRIILSHSNTTLERPYCFANTDSRCRAFQDIILASTANPTVTGDVKQDAIASVTGAVGSVTGAVGSVTSGVTVSTNNDKTGYGLSGTQSFNLTGNITGNLSGNVGGNVAGSVASVADKTGFRLSAAGVDDIWDEILSGHATSGSAGLLITGAGNPWSIATSGNNTAGTFGAFVQSNGSGGPIEQRPVASSRTLLLKTRTDGTFGVQGRVRMSPGDTLLWAIECSPHLPPGVNIYGVSALTIGGADAAKMTNVSRGVSLTKAKFELALSGTASSANVITLIVPVQLSATETINVNIDVTVGP